MLQEIGNQKCQSVPKTHDFWEVATIRTKQCTKPWPKKINKQTMLGQQDAFKARSIRDLEINRGSGKAIKAKKRILS